MPIKSGDRVWFWHKEAGEKHSRRLYGTVRRLSQDKKIVQIVLDSQTLTNRPVKQVFLETPRGEDK